MAAAGGCCAPAAARMTLHTHTYTKPQLSTHTCTASPGRPHKLVLKIEAWQMHNKTLRALDVHKHSSTHTKTHTQSERAREREIIAKQATAADENTLQCKAIKVSN